MTEIDSLIDNNKGLVYAQLHKFNLVNDPEAESIAFEALFRAISTFNPEAGTRLSTYATVIIYNTLGSYVRSLNTKRRVQTISYNSIAFIDDTGEHEFVDFLAAEEDIERNYMQAELQKTAMQTFDTLYDTLTNDTHRKVLKAWKDSDFEAQTKDIATDVGVSQSYVSQVINNFKFKMKKKLEGIYYD